MVAVAMRQILDKAMEEKMMIRKNKSCSYAKRITETKFVRRAKKGYSNCEFKVSRWYSPAVVVEALEEMGYEVKRNSKNGKAVLAIKW